MKEDHRSWTKAERQLIGGLTSGCTRRRRVARAPLSGAGKPDR